MLLTRHYLRITNSTRSLVNKNISLKHKLPTLPCPCRNRDSRTFSSISQKKILMKNGVQFFSTVSNDKSPKVLSQGSASSEEILEKYIANLSSDLHQKNRVYKNDLMKVINKVAEFNFSTKKQGLMLIRCCTELLPDESSSSRLALVELVWNTLKSHTKFQVEHYNEMLRVYIANNRTLKASSFISQMDPIKPNIITYELILRALGEAGDINQATEVISNMKSQNLPATDNIFHSLIICQGKAGNLNNVQEILTMMKSLKLEPSVETHTAIARALAYNKETKLLLEEMDKAKRSRLQFGEVHIMEIVKTLAGIGAYEAVPQVLRYLPEETLNSPSISPYMQSVSTLLVFQNHPTVALEIYKCLPLPSFGPKDDQGLHGRSLVRDCVKASIPSSVIGLITQELMSSGRNPIALHNASEAALQLGKVPLALDLFMRMKQLSMPLRPHYFWPILLHNSKSYGEKGIMKTLSNMVSMEVKPDFETIMEYTLPYVSFTSPQNLMKKFQDTGLAVSTVLTPMMVTLLNTGQVRAASEICELFQGKVDVEKILKPLLKGYLTSADVKSTVHILEDVLKKATDKNKDWVGRFLCVFMQHKRIVEDVSDFIELIKAIKSAGIKISAPAADYCMGRLPERHSEEMTEAFRNNLIDITDNRLVDEAEIFVQQMPHPKHMNEESLKAHLNELEAKGMNTRGVLRKLLQQYCREGDLAAAKDIAEKCRQEGVALSAGMKAAIFDLHVKLGEFDLAEMALADLNKSSPNFTLDEYKVIDFATLMVNKEKIDQALELINEQSKKRHVVGGRSISINCWRLLDATATHGSVQQTRQMFELLSTMRYCKPSNVILGPLIRVHLKNDNLQEAVNEFSRLATKYNKTPLKHELLCAILKSMGDSQSEDVIITSENSNEKLNKLAQTVLSINKKVHGAGDVHLSLIAALADVGYKKNLRKLFLDPTVRLHPDSLLRRCERFAEERKVFALENIAQCARDLRHIDVDQIYELMLDVYQRDDNCADALSLWTRMQESDVTPSQKFVRKICSLIKANNQPIPSELTILLDKQAKKASNL